MTKVIKMPKQSPEAQTASSNQPDSQVDLRDVAQWYSTHADANSLVAGIPGAFQYGNAVCWQQLPEDAKKAVIAAYESTLEQVKTITQVNSPSATPPEPEPKPVKLAVSREQAAEVIAKAGADYLHMYPDGDVWFTYNRAQLAVMRLDYRNAAQLQSAVKVTLDRWDAEHPEKKASRKPGKA